MVNVSHLAKKSLRNLTTYFHGGNVWEASKKYKIPVNQLIDFSISTNPTGAPKKALNIIRQNLNLIHHYPDPNPSWLMETFAKSVGVTPDNIVIGNGSTELIYLFTEIFLDSEYKALVPIPSFSEYKAAIERTGGKMVLLKCESANNFQLNLEELERSISKKTRIIFLCNPNSPTGCLYKKDDLLYIIEIAVKENILIFLDEDYINFVKNANSLD
jgi:threonine-phosphate decarboxylase